MSSSSNNSQSQSSNNSNIDQPATINATYSLSFSGLDGNRNNNNNEQPLKYVKAPSPVILKMGSPPRHPSGLTFWQALEKYASSIVQEDISAVVIGYYQPAEFGAWHECDYDDNNEKDFSRVHAGIELEKINIDSSEYRKKILTPDEASKVLSTYPYYEDHSGPSCHSIYAWTINFVIFVVQYDGKVWFDHVPRNPIECYPTMSGR